MHVHRILLLGLACICLFPHGAEAFFAREPKGPTNSLSVRAIPVESESVLPGAQHVPMLQIRFMAPCTERVRIESIEVQLIGLGEATDIEGVYIEANEVRLSRRMPISSGVATLRPRNLIVQACSSRTITIAADFNAAATVGGEFALRIVAPEDIRTNGMPVTGSFPMSTNGTLTLEVSPLSSGSVTANFLPPPSYIPLNNNSLAKFTLEAVDGAPYQCVQSITLTNDGTARDDEMRDLYIARSNGEPLTQIEGALEDDQVTLEFLEPYCLEEQKSQLFELWGKAFTRKETNEFELEEPSDIYAVPLWRLPRE